MELLMAILIGVLFAAGTYMLLERRLLRIIFGTNLISYGALLFLLTSGKLGRGNAPILTDGVTQYADPLPQALILTAIVINFAVTAFCLVLAYRSYQDIGTDDTATPQLRGVQTAADAMTETTTETTTEAMAGHSPAQLNREMEVAHHHD